MTEVEELTSERSPPLGGGVDPAEKFGSRVRFRERIDLSPQPVTRAQDRLEQIVEVVSDSSREAADRIHFHGLAQLLREFSLARDIACEAVVRAGLSVRNGDQKDVGVERRTVFTTPLDGDFLSPASREGGHGALEFVPVVLEDPIVGFRTHQGRGVGGVHGSKRGVDRQQSSVSIDPRDTPARADSAKARFVNLAAFGDLNAFHFWTVGEEHEASVQALADAVGFRYAWDARTGEYAHNAANVLLSPTGTVTRYLYGIDFDPKTVKLGLLEASEGTVGNALDRFLITCYEYDEDAQSYSLAVLTVTKIGGGLLLLVFGGLLVYFWRREAKSPDAWADARPAPTP